jgi:hypothetical protein
MMEDEIATQPEAPLILPPATGVAPDKGTSPVIVEPASATRSEDVFGFAAQVGFDPGVWFTKTLEFWDESLQALTAHGGDIAKTRSIEEAIELQTRFAIGRLDHLNRQLRGLLQLVSGGVDFTSLWGAPRGTRAR